MSKANADGYTCLEMIAAMPVVVATTTILSGWVGASLWNWFVQPLFHTFTITWWQAVGVSMMLSWFTYQVDAVPASEDKGGVSGRLIAIYVRYPITWAFAWLFHHFFH